MMQVEHIDCSRPRHGTIVATYLRLLLKNYTSSFLIMSSGDALRKIITLSWRLLSIQLLIFQLNVFFASDLNVLGLPSQETGVRRQVLRH